MRSRWSPDSTSRMRVRSRASCVAPSSVSSAVSSLFSNSPTTDAYSDSSRRSAGPKVPGSCESKKTNASRSRLRNSGTVYEER